MNKNQFNQQWLARLRPLLIILIVSGIGIVVLNVSRAATYTNYRDPVTRSTASIKDGAEFQDCLPNGTSVPCYQAYLNDINHARQVLEPGIPAMNINIGQLMSLPPDKQLFVLANAERVDRGEQPFAALTSQLNGLALAGAQASRDPTLVAKLTGNIPTNRGASNWAGGNYFNPIVSDYIWMYDDGAATSNQECSAPGQALCWGHRFNILENGFNSCDPYMGAAYSPVSTNLVRSYTEIMEGTCSGSPTDTVYTWQQALNSGVYTPPAGSGGSSPVCPSSTLAVNQQLTAKQCIVSPNGQYELRFSPAGDTGSLLQIYNISAKKQIWTSHCGGTGEYLAFGSDGNLVEYTPNPTFACWSSGTHGLGATLITMQNDGNLVMTTASGEIVWSSQTGIIIDPPATLNANEKLLPAEQLFSVRDQYRLVLQKDGNLVIYNHNNIATWATHTNGNTPADLAMQSDGNLVLYNTAGKAIWSSNTRTLGGTHVTMQDDGNLVILTDAGRPVWSIATGIVPPPPPPPGPTLNAGKALGVNQYLLSAQGKYQLILQADGNLVEYATAGHRPVWQTNTDGKDSDHLAMQADGNLVLYGRKSEVLWYSNTRTLGGTHVILQDDSNLVIKNAADTPVWSIMTGIIAPPPPPPSPVLNAGQALVVNQYLLSAQGQYQLILQADGNLVLYATAGHRPVWQTNTLGKDSDHLAMQSDGNLVLYGKKGEVLWYSNTRTLGGNHVVLQDDSNLVIQNVAGTPVWSIMTGIIAPPPPPPPPPAPMTLYAGQGLTPGQYLLAADGSHQFIFQQDGNLVLYNKAHQAIWQSGTFGSGATLLIMQPDGNLVLYSGPKIAWYSNTYGVGAPGGNHLVCQPDGNTVMYNSLNQVVWQTGTYGR
jgi:hypothetical protein